VIFIHIRKQKKRYSNYFDDKFEQQVVAVRAAERLGFIVPAGICIGS